MKTSEAFRLTKLRVEISPAYLYSQYICLAAEEVGVEVIVRAIIMPLLNGNSTLGGWLDERGIDCFSTKEAKRKLQRTRHAWLDHLIAHYESLGD